MRQFIVLGYQTTNTNEPGVIVHLGNKNSVAIGVVTASGDGFARKELFELAVPRQRRHFEDKGQGTGDRGQEEIASLPRNDGEVDDLDKLNDLDDMDDLNPSKEDPLDDDDIGDGAADPDGAPEPLSELSDPDGYDDLPVTRRKRVNGRFVKGGGK